MCFKCASFNFAGYEHTKGAQREHTRTVSATLDFFGTLWYSDTIYSAILFDRDDMKTPTFVEMFFFALHTNMLIFTCLQ